MTGRLENASELVQCCCPWIMISLLQSQNHPCNYLLTVKTTTPKLQVVGFLGEWKKEESIPSPTQHLKLTKMGEEGALLTDVNSQ